MSTQINVIVDDGGLSAKARQQMQANRWAQMEAEARAKAEQKAKDEKAKQDAKTGTTQDGQRSRSNFRAEEPAAFQYGKPDGAIAWFDNAYLGSAEWTWRTPGTYGQGAYVINGQDKFSFSVGSGDGTQWANAQLTLTGINQFRNQMESVFAEGFNNPFDNLDTVGQWISGQKRAADDTVLRRLWLPCGKGVGVFIVHAQAGGGFHAFGRQITNVDGGYASEFSYQEFGPWTLTTRDCAAFLVSNTTCRQLPLPTALTDCLDTVFPVPTFNNQRFYAWKRPGPDNSFPYEPAYVPLRSLSGPYKYTLAFSDYSYKPPFYNELVELPYQFDYYAMDDLSSSLLGSFGVRAELMEDATTSFYMSESSPGLFTILLNPAALNLSDLTQFSTYGFAATQLKAAGAKPPTKVIAVDQRDASIKAFNQLAYSGDIPADLYQYDGIGFDGVPLALSPRLPTADGNVISPTDSWISLKKVPLSNLRVSKQYPDCFLNSDWGQPSYCRQKLLELGFIDADLTP